MSEIEIADIANRGWRRSADSTLLGIRRIACLAVAAVSLVACGRNDDAPTSTTESTTTTETTTTTTEATTTTLSPDEADEAAIRELVAKNATFWPTAGNPPDPDHPLIDGLFVDPMRGRVTNTLESDRNSGAQTNGEILIEVRGFVGLGEDEVTVTACFKDDSYTERPDGERIFEGDGDWQFEELHVVRTDDG